MPCGTVRCPLSLFCLSVCRSRALSLSLVILAILKVLPELIFHAQSIGRLRFCLLDGLLGKSNFLKIQQRTIHRFATFGVFVFATKIPSSAERKQRKTGRTSGDIRASPVNTQTYQTVLRVVY